MRAYYQLLLNLFINGLFQTGVSHWRHAFAHKKFKRTAYKQYKVI